MWPQTVRSWARSMRSRMFRVTEARTRTAPAAARCADCSTTNLPFPTVSLVASAGSAVGFAALAHALGRRRLTPGVRGRVTAGALGLSVVSAALNAASPSAQERMIWAPFALTQIALLVAARRQEGTRHRVAVLG